jgi:hypothetical protein
MYSEMMCRVVWYIPTDVSQLLVASIMALMSEWPVNCRIRIECCRYMKQLGIYTN